MFIGRMSPDKGPDRAIEVARRAGRPIVLAAKMREPGEMAYYEQHVRPLLGPDATFLGEADTATRLEFLQNAEALVNPIRWPEPFGLVMAESLACATPVIAMPYGAAPEIVDDGRTGFLCSGFDEMVEAVDRIGDIDRQVCRQAALERFSVDRMAADHTALYRRLVARARGAQVEVDGALDPSAARAMTASATAPLGLVGTGSAATRNAAANGTRTLARRALGTRRPLGGLESSG
jgi:glycosyltransferase involved in cell wall biosynthesis